MKHLREEKAFEVVKHVVEYNGCELEIYMPATDGGLLGEILGEEDTYHIDKLVPEGSDVVDLGANVGVFALACLTRKCNVFAVEASPITHALLKANVDRFPNALAFNQVVSSPDVWNRWPMTVVPFMTNLQHFAGSAESLEGDHLISKVPAYFQPRWPVTGEGQRTRVLKIDIEGSEKQLFDPKNEAFFVEANVVLLEWHLYDGHVYREYLEHLGFKVALAGCGSPQPQYDKTFARGMLYATRGL